MNIKWDAEKYTSDFSFVHRYGGDVAEMIDAGAGSLVLDLGCGNGALTKALLDKGYKVTGMDASGELLAVARESCPSIRFIQGDATDFALSEPVDVVFSNAVFHWIEKEKQPDMINCVHKALKATGDEPTPVSGGGFAPVRRQSPWQYGSISCGLFLARTQIRSPETASHSTRCNIRAIFRAEEAALLTQGNDDKRKSAEKGPRGAAWVRLPSP